LNTTLLEQNTLGKH